MRRPQAMNFTITEGGSFVEVMEIMVVLKTNHGGVIKFTSLNPNLINIAINHLVLKDQLSYDDWRSLIYLVLGNEKSLPESAICQYEMLDLHRTSFEWIKTRKCSELEIEQFKFEKKDQFFNFIHGLKIKDSRLKIASLKEDCTSKRWPGLHI